MEQQKAEVAVFLSGGGSNLQALIDATNSGILNAHIALVVSSKFKAFGLERARKASVETFVFKLRKYATPEDAAIELLKKLQQHEVDYIALSGYLALLPPQIVAAYRDRIVNVHPALLPKYGGKGMYGRHVHEAVLASGDRESGVSVHLVNEVYDDGRVLEQVKVPVMPDDTVQSLAERVLKQEHRLFPRVLDKLIRGEYESKDD